MSAGFSSQEALWTYPLMDWGAAGSEPRFYISPRPLTFEVNRLPSTLLSKPQVEVTLRGVCSQGDMGLRTAARAGVTQEDYYDPKLPRGGLATSERALVSDGAKQEPNRSSPAWKDQLHSEGRGLGGYAHPVFTVGRGRRSLGERPG